jgi:hypothetical protein
MYLPIPSFYSVYAIRREADVQVLIALDPNAGLQDRYSVIWLNLRTGITVCIGRELPLHHASEIAEHACREAALRHEVP